MAENSKIEWCDTTWNPTTGCTKISPGCAHCYIETTPPFRMEGRKFVKGHIPLRLHADRLDKPLHWRKPRRVFVNSLSDLFHEDVPEEFIRQVIDVMVQAGYQRGHTFQVLTKRPERMRDAVQRYIDHGHLCGAGPFCQDVHGEAAHKSLPPFIWLGVSAEDQQRADERIPWLLKTPAAVRFVSAEPLLSAVDLGLRNWATLDRDDCRLDWVIVGGESGRGARPCSMQDIRLIVEDCQAAGVACFVKQLGSNIIFSDDTWGSTRTPRSEFDRDRSKQWCMTKHPKGGDPDEWPDWLRVRQFPQPCGGGR